MSHNRGGAKKGEKVNLDFKLTFKLTSKLTSKLTFKLTFFSCSCLDFLLSPHSISQKSAILHLSLLFLVDFPFQPQGICHN